ncbi:MAG: S9 family peptidase [Rhodospirillales bacterium]
MTQAQNTSEVLTRAPVAARKPFRVESPAGVREDDYYWLRDDSRSNPEVLAYLKAENQWYAQHAAPYSALTEKLFGEIKARIKPDLYVYLFHLHGYFYYTRFDQGREYPIYARRRGTLDAAEEILLDVNLLAAGHDYFQAAPAAISFSQSLCAYFEDSVGRRQYTLRIKNLATGELYPDAISGTSGDAVWAKDEKTLFYVANDPVTLRSYRIKKHRLGTDPATDPVVYEEKDASFYTDIGHTGSEQFIVIHVHSTVSDEQRVLAADQPDGEFQLVAPRRRDFHYQADHIPGRWVIRTDWNAPNYRLMEVAEGKLGDRRRWKNLLAHSDAVFINNFDLFERYLVVDERSEGLRRLRIQPWADGKPVGTATYVKADEPAYTTSLSVNPEQNSEVLRYNYSSLTTPVSTFDLNMRTGERKLMKRAPVLGGFDSANYLTERVWVTARDGARVPVSLVYRKGTRRDGSAPLFQYGYGSYGASLDPAFVSSIISLLDRGFVYAIAHVRGGEEMGRAWYEHGKKLYKRNTFTDFVDVTESLVKSGYGAQDKIFASGRSAGGLLMGAVANLRPDLYRGILADVPFVDVVTTMLDESIPLTTNEFDEWGNPKQKKFYDYMLSYSPYDNVRAQAYPAMMVTTGLVDSQVQYFEPAKWVAKLRATKTDTHPLVFKTNMEAGHGGKSGRYTRQREYAEEYAFMLDQLGVRD